MRTTVSIEDHLLAEARAQARQRGQTLSRFVEDAVRHEIVRATTRTEGPPIPVFSGGDGPRPGVELAANRALRELLDEGSHLEELR